MEPIPSLLPPAPDTLLNSIFCNCSKSCGFNCGCRKIGLKCSAVCGHCHGQSCLNAAPDAIEECYVDSYENVDPADFLAEAMEIEQVDAEVMDIDPTEGIEEEAET